MPQNSRNCRYVKKLRHIQGLFKASPTSITKSSEAFLQHATDFPNLSLLFFSGYIKNRDFSQKINKWNKIKQKENRPWLCEPISWVGASQFKRLNHRFREPTVQSSEPETFSLYDLKELKFFDSLSRIFSSANQQSGLIYDISIDTPFQLMKQDRLSGRSQRTS